MCVSFVIFQFIIWMSGCMVKKFIDAVFNVVPLTYINICVNIYNYGYYVSVDLAGNTIYWHHSLVLCVDVVNVGHV